MAVFVSLWRLNGVVFIGHMVMIELLFILLGTSLCNISIEEKRPAITFINQANSKPNADL